MTLESLQTALGTAFDDSPTRELAFKKMFGGACAYYNGTVFASLSNVGLALKLPADAQKELLALGREMLQYEADAPISKSYCVVPETIVREPEELAVWVEKSLAFVARKPVKNNRGIEKHIIYL